MEVNTKPLEEIEESERVLEKPVVKVDYFQVFCGLVALIDAMGKEKDKIETELKEFRHNLPSGGVGIVKKICMAVVGKAIYDNSDFILMEQFASESEKIRRIKVLDNEIKALQSIIAQAFILEPVLPVDPVEHEGAQQAEDEAAVESTVVKESPSLYERICSFFLYIKGLITLVFSKI